MAQPAQATSGTLAQKPLAHLFVYALDKELTGTLELAQPGGAESALVSLSKGKVAKIRTSAPVVYLGTVLYEMAFIDDVELNASLLELAKQRRPHGQILLARGTLTRAQLAEGLREQALRKLAYLFSFAGEATFTFRAEVDALAGYGGDDVVLTDPFPAIWRGIREHPSSAHVQDVLGRIGLSACRLVPGARLERFQLQREELAAAGLLRGRPIGLVDLSATRLLPPRLAELLFYCLLITKQLEIATEARASSPSVPSPSPAEAAPRAESVRPSISRMPAAAPVSPSRSDMTAVRASSSGVPAQRTISSPSMPAVRAASSSSIPAMRPPSRTDVPVQRLEPISFNLRIPSPVRASAPPRISSNPPSGALAGELAARAKVIHDRARAIQNEDMFQRLSLPRDATSKQIDDAFIALSRIWDTANLPPALDGAREDCALVLSMLTEAHDVLTDVRKRGEYVRKLRVGMLPPDPAEDLKASGADNEYDGAKACLAKGDLERAERLAKRAHKAQPERAAALALLAWIEASKPSNQAPDATRVRLAMLDRAVKLDQSCEDAFYFRAQLHKRLENHAAAMKDLTRVTTLNPGNVDAARELRIYEMRVRHNSASRMDAVRPSSSDSAKPSGAPGGLFDRFLKK